MITIGSTSNPKVKFVRSLARRRVRQQEGCFAIEGRRLVQDALQAGVRPRMAFVTEAFEDSPEGAALAANLRAASREFYGASPSVMETLSDTVTPQGVVAVVDFPQWPEPSAPKRLALILDGWRDPGNLGTALRTAEAAGADWVALTEGTVDPFSPKVVRAGMGAHFRLPVFADWRWSEIRRILRSVPVYLADAAASLAYDDVDWTRPSALVVGGEAHGVRDAARQTGATEIAIPMAGQVESLNAAMAAGIIMMEAARQRRRG